MLKTSSFKKISCTVCNHTWDQCLSKPNPIECPKCRDGKDIKWALGPLLNDLINSVVYTTQIKCYNEARPYSAHRIRELYENEESCRQKFWDRLEELTGNLKKNSD